MMILWRRQEELTAALDVMEKALAGQKAAKLEELKSAIQEAQNLNSDSYTETSFAALTEAVETASAAAENPESTLAEILQQISALDAARKALIADMDWSALDAQIEAAESIKKSQYTTASYQYMYNTLVEAREMRALPDTNLPSQEEIDALADELEARIASLVPLSSGSGGTTVTFEPASGEEFDRLQDAVSTAKEKLGGLRGRKCHPSGSGNGSGGQKDQLRRSESADFGSRFTGTVFRRDGNGRQRGSGCSDDSSRGDRSDK